MSGRIVQEHPQLLDCVKSKESKGVLSSIEGPLSQQFKNAWCFRINSRNPLLLSCQFSTAMSQRILFVFTSVSQSLEGDNTVN
jgi:hypothetical protein